MSLNKNWEEEEACTGGGGEGLFVFNDTIEGPRALAVKLGRNKGPLCVCVNTFDASTADNRIMPSSRSG